MKRFVTFFPIAAALMITITPGVTPAFADPSRADLAASPTGPVTLQTKTGTAGTYLTDGLGNSLYLFQADTPRTSTCSGSCATVWPPLTASGGSTSITAGTGVTMSLISTITRSDGSTQVTYNGWPLYYYSGDTSASNTNGQGITSFGALWYLVNPTGTALTSAPGTTGSAGTPTAGTPSSGYPTGTAGYNSTSGCTIDYDMNGNPYSTCAGTTGCVVYYDINGNPFTACAGNSGCMTYTDTSGNVFYQNCSAGTLPPGYLPGYMPDYNYHPGHNPPHSGHP